jgi:hypothetical protein
VGEEGPGKDNTAADSEQPPPARVRRPAWLRWEVRALLELSALCGLAFTQPLLDVTGRSPDFFQFHGVQGWDLVLVAVVFAVAPPVVLLAVGALGWLAGWRARRTTHTALVAVLFTVLAVVIGKHLLTLRGTGLVALALLAAAGMVVLYVRFKATGQVLRLASVVPVVAVLLFVFASPTSALMPPTRQPPTAPVGATGGSHPPIVVLILDEFPQVSLLDGDGRIDAARFPNFARLAHGSTWYRNATGTSNWTPYALPAMLTGRYPAKQVAPHYSQYPQNLFTLLGRTYSIKAQESITLMCPPGFCQTGRSDRQLRTVLKQSAGVLGNIVSPVDSDRDPTTSLREPTVQERSGADPGAGPTFRWDRLADNQPVRFQQFLADLQPSPGPTMHFLHLLMPHAPWNYLPSGMRYPAPDYFPTDTGWWTQLAHQRHSLQVAYTDRLLGEAMRVLHDTGLYDQALVVVTADHGISFSAGAYGRGTEAMRGSPAELMWVPLFVKQPHQQAGQVDERNWQHIDLLPTIADYAGITVPWPTDGISALKPPRPQTDKVVYDSLDRRTIDGPSNLATIKRGSGALPRLPGAPRPDLVGRSTTQFRIDDGGPTATVDNLDAFSDVQPESGSIPALVWGTVPASMPEGSLLAVAVNGRIGAVGPVAAGDDGAHQFAVVVPDETLFVPGANRLELFAVSDDAITLRRLAL